MPNCISAHEPQLAFLNGGGEMGALIREMNWTGNPLGEPSSWPLALQYSVSLMLTSSFPMLICWGEEYIQLYNDAFRPINGNTKHPQALGGSAKDTYTEIWSSIGPMFAGVLTGKTFGFPDFKVQLDRNGRLEDCYFDFSYSPISDLDGRIGGVLVICNETTSRVRALEDLKESNHNYRTFIEETSIASALYFGPEIQIQYANDVMLSYWGRDKSVFGKTFRQALPELESQPFPALLERVYTTGQTYNGIEEQTTLLVNGVPRTAYYNYTYKPLLDAEGRVYGILHTAFDVSDQVMARNGLQAMVDSAPFPIGVYTGREMTITLANPSMLKGWGKGKNVIGKRYAEVLPELSEQHVYEQLDEVFTTGKPFHARNQMLELYVDGKLCHFFFNYSFTPLFDINGKVYGVMNTAADVTDLNEAKQQIEQSEKNFRSMILQAPVAMCLLSGPEHRIEIVNQSMLDIWGKPIEEVINKPVFTALPDARKQGLEEVMRNVYQTGKPFYANELPVALIRYGKPDIVYQNFVYDGYHDANGNILGILAISVDVTEQVLARQKIEKSEAELRQIKAQLEAELAADKLIQQQKDGFIGMASHELKTPLTSLTAILQVLNAKLKSGADSFLKGALAKANVQTKKMAMMINGFLNISRLESGQMVIERATFELTKLIEELLEELQFIGTSHTLSFHPCPAVFVDADRDKIGLVITNLVSNAIKYSPKGSLVEVTCEQIENQIKISVKDKGMGIPEEDQPHLFERYYRVQDNRNKHIAGFGIGLYLSSEIVALHGTKLQLESELGKGSVFYFSLPVAKGK